MTRLDEPTTVSVIGGAGHVGLPMCLVLADAGHQVYGIDKDEHANRQIMSGQMPFMEEGGQRLLKKALSEERLQMTSDTDPVSASDVVMVVIGTPVDEHLNPVVEPLLNLIEDISDHLRDGQLLVLRSTVSPGTTDNVRRKIEEETTLTVGNDIDLVFAPERVAEGQAIRELRTLPQLVGAYDEDAHGRAERFFDTFLEAQCIPLTPKEAEVGKLLTNVTRYVNFAIANECQLIGESFDVNINKVIDATNQDYPRMDLPSPGPNVGGPCLYKDGWFLIERIPYNELISSAFRINEGMPAHIIQRLEEEDGIERVAILGMAYKPNIDDIRNSVSFKLKKQLEFRGYETVPVEPHVDGFDPLEAIEGCDAAVLMTPHDAFGDLDEIMDLVGNDGCLYVDIWGAWEEMRYESDCGFFLGREVHR